MANSFPSAGGGSRPGSYQRRNVDPFAAIRRNHRIKVPQVRVISPEGKQLGILPTIDLKVTLRDLHKLFGGDSQ